MAATSGPFRSIHNLVGLNSVGGARDKELVPHCERTHPRPLPYSPRAEEASVDVCVCMRVILPLTGTNLATNRSIHVRSIIQRVRVVARKRVPTKIPAFSQTEINAPFPPIVIDNAVLTRLSRRLFRETRES